MPCKIFLRFDQTSAQRASSKSEDVFVFAPAWVKEGLKILGEKLTGLEFTVLERESVKRGGDSSKSKPIERVLERFKITEDFDNLNLVLLQKISRNEPKNTTGRVSTSYFQPDLKDLKVIYSIKDLARQTVVVGKDMTTHYGGYNSQRISQREPVYVCDLAALQFLQPYNSGRLVLIQEGEGIKGLLDDFIFENVVGEKRKSFGEVTQLISANDEEAKRRYLKNEGIGKGPCYLDALAYKRFVKLDVVLTGLAFSDKADKQGHKLNFKFLKYGTGKFVGKFANHINSLILPGVIDGIEELLDKHGESSRNVIKHLSFPFYNCDGESKRRLDEIKKKYEIDYDFLREDALKQTKPGKGLMTATTNCANSYAAFGNSMGASTDGSIAKNLVSKGNIFCPNMNSLIQHKYVVI